jgi:DinB superfamily
MKAGNFSGFFRPYPNPQIPPLPSPGTERPTPPGASLSHDVLVGSTLDVRMQDVAAIVELLNRAHLEFIEACEQIPATRWTKAPAKGSWSAGEIVAHLTMVETAVWTGAREELSHKARRHSLLQRIHIPVAVTAWRGIKRKTPIPLDSALVKARQEALEGYSSARNRTLKLIAEQSSRNLAHYRRQHPFLGSLNLYDWMRVLAYHEIRHTKQIREIGRSFQS